MAVITGNGLTDTAANAVFVQPTAVPITVKVVVSNGETVSGFKVEPVFQVQVVAPADVNVADCPTQIVDELTVTIGNGLTDTVATAVFVQPAVVPVTVKFVVDNGVTVSGFKVEPVFQVQVVAPADVKVVDCPKHIVGELTVTIGNGLTDTVATAVFVQPAVVPVTV